MSTVTAQVQNAGLETGSGNADATVSFSDVLPTESVAKTASVDWLVQPGGTVSYSVVVTNTSPEGVTVTIGADSQIQVNDLTVTADHSTPAKLSNHSWHSVPTLLAADTCRTDACEAFGETESLRGGLGRFESIDLMPLLLAHAGRLGKFGA